MPAAPQRSPISEKVPVVVVLSGVRRGRIEKLGPKTLHVVVAPDSEIRFLPPEEPAPTGFQATLHRAGESYEIEVMPGHAVWVNGERVEQSRLLVSGDLLEIGKNGVVARFRLYPKGATPSKSFTEAFADSIDGARADGRSGLGTVTRFFGNLTRDLTTQTSVWFRVWVLIVLTALVVSIALLVVQSLRLQKRMVMEGTRIEGLAEMLERTGAEAMTRDDLLSMREEVEARLAAAVHRVQALEARADQVARVIAAATPSIVFVQGAYGFVEPDTGRVLRFVEPERGIKVFTLEDKGQPVEIMFSGTGFVVSEDGSLLTNRHVAEPWLEDEQTEMAKQRGLVPVIQRLLAFLPNVKEALELEVVRVNEDADLALLRMPRPIEHVSALALRAESPRPGEEVVVLGYPMGMEGLMVRVSREFVESITPDGEVDFWTIGRALSDAGYIKPLATRGIVGQVTADIVLYDAETAVGGSGGPVLDLSGSVVAINRAVMREFGGSNIGVPARLGIEFLERPAAKE